MYNTDFFIDFIQNTKKQFVNVVFSDQDKIKNGLNEFVDNQTVLTKTIVKNYVDFNKLYFDGIFKNGK